MRVEEDRDEVPVHDARAKRLLARAAELDAARAVGLSSAQLREIAREAGIAPEAFDAALSDPALAEVSAEGHASVPFWVRLCMFGVPDRSAAMGYYWLFVAGLCACPLLALQGVRSVPVVLLGGASLAFALWSTSRAIRWLDRHGWEQLS